MNKKILLLFLLLAGIAYGYMAFHATKNPSDAKIREMFACDRLTKEFRSTDKYCRDPDLYRREHAK